MQSEVLPFEVVAPAAGLAPDTLGESPAWCARSQVLWWVDIRAPQVRRWSAGSGVFDRWPMPELCGAVVPTTGAQVAVALRGDIRLFDPASGTLAPLVTLETGQPAHRLNEARCDRQGRLWCGSMWDFGRQPTGALYRVAPQQGSMVARRVRAGVTIPNGIGFAPDGDRMVFVDTATGCIEVAPYDIEEGMPGAWRTLVEAGAAPGKPDGNAVDAQGCIWSARFGAGCLARFTPQGRLDRVIALPVSQPTACVFGGADLATLFVTSATQRMAPEARAGEPLAGALLALRPGVQGLAESPLRLPSPANAWQDIQSPNPSNH